MTDKKASQMAPSRYKTAEVLDLDIRKNEKKNKYTMFLFL